MKIPLWLIALLFAGYTVWCANYWHNYCKTRCCGDGAPALTETSGVPLFNWNAEKPVEDAKFRDWKKSFLKTGGQGDTLVITGHYRANEPGGEKLGMARAQALKAMMMPEMPESRLHLKSKLIAPDSLAEGSPPKESASFSWSKMVLKAEESAIIEADNAITFLFPTNSTERERDSAVDAYLTKLVEKHKATTKTFSVVGYADNVGEPDKNYQLGLARANSIALFLSKSGIDQKRITVSSKGEEDPVADNNTEDGRRQNRRVVITVNN